VFPLNLYAHVRISLMHIAHETAGAARTRSSLRPLVFRGQTNWQTSGKIMSRERELTSRRPRETGTTRYMDQRIAPHPRCGTLPTRAVALAPQSAIDKHSYRNVSLRCPDDGRNFAAVRGARTVTLVGGTHGLEDTEDRRSAGWHGNQHVRLRGPQVSHATTYSARETPPHRWRRSRAELFLGLAISAWRMLRTPRHNQGASATAAAGSR
jgi:hypothetical protein